ncbi:MAG: IclR family transcriptional regulator [Halovenus sp.]
MGPEPEPETNGRALQTVGTMFEIVNLLKERDGVKATELAAELDLSRSAVYNHLITLQEHEWIVRENNEYHLSLKFFRYGIAVRNDNRLFSIAKPKVKELARETGETAHLTTEQHGYQVNLLKETNGPAVGESYHTQKLQQVSYHHDTASGKALLAFLPRERVEWILDRQGLPQKTAHTITDREALHAELERIRDRGYAINDEEEIEGLRAVGTAIQDTDGTVLGAVSVSGPTSRLKGSRFTDELPEKVMSAANVIELNLNMERRVTGGDGV